MKTLSDDGLAFVAVLVGLKIPPMLRSLDRTEHRIQPNEAMLVKKTLKLHERLCTGDYRVDDTEAETIVGCANLCSRQHCRLHGQEEKPYSDFGFTEGGFSATPPAKRYEDWFWMAKQGKLG